MSKPGAAVFGSSVVSFMADVPQAHRESVILALLMAEHSTHEAVAQGLVDDWFAYYRKQLLFYGWDAAPPEQAHWPDEQRPKLLDKALQTIGEVAGERHVLVMTLAFEGLRNAHFELLRFEERAREGGSFRLLPCGPSGGGRVDMVLYHEVVTSRRADNGILFVERQLVNVRAELVRFNVRLFDQIYRARVERALGIVQRKQIVDIKLPAPSAG